MRRFDTYKIKRGDNLGDSTFWNPRFEDIDLRLASQEDFKLGLQGTVDSLTALALSRLNDTFLPLITEAQNRLNSLAVSFSAEALSTLTVSTGVKVFTLTEESAANYVFTDYITARAAGAEDNTLTGRVTGFDRATRQLTVDVDRAVGSGTYGDWLIRVGYPPGSNHETDYENPHQTTAAQVGSYTIAEADAAVAAAIVAAIAALALQSASQHPATDFAAAAHSHDIGSLTGSVGYANMAASALASAAELRALTASKLVTTGSITASNAYLAGGNISGAVALDFTQFVNVAYTQTGDVTFSISGGAVPAALVGTSGIIELTQDATGNRSVTWGTGFKFTDAVAPVLDKAASRINSINYHIRSTTAVYVNLAFHGVR